MKSKIRNRLTAVSFFSGAGGISCGFEMAGLNGILGLDNYDAAVETYSNYFKHPCFSGDITKTNVKSDFIENVQISIRITFFYFIINS